MRVADARIARDNQLWDSKLVSIHDLKWHALTKKVYFFDYHRAEVEAVRNENATFVDNFEQAWFDRRENGDVATRKIEKLAMKRFSTYLGECWDVSLDKAYEFRFFDLIDRLYEVREGQKIFGKQHLKSRVDTILHQWPWFTDALVAVVTAYECTEILKWDTYQRKVQEIKIRESQGEPNDQQKNAFNPALRLLFPEVAMDLYQDM